MSAISLSDLTSQHYSACVPLRSFVRSFIHSFAPLSYHHHHHQLSYSTQAANMMRYTFDWKWFVNANTLDEWMRNVLFDTSQCFECVFVCADELSRRVARNTNKSVFVLCISRNKSTAWSARKKHAKWWFFGINIERNTTANGTQNGPEKRNKQP